MVRNSWRTNRKEQGRRVGTHRSHSEHSGQPLRPACACSRRRRLRSAQCCARQEGGCFGHDEPNQGETRVVGEERANLRAIPPRQGGEVPNSSDSAESSRIVTIVCSGQVVGFRERHVVPNRYNSTVLSRNSGEFLLQHAFPKS